MYGKVNTSAAVQCGSRRQLLFRIVRKNPTIALTNATAHGTIIAGVGTLSTFKKVLQRVKNNPQQVRFEELDHILIKKGFIKRQPRGGSSHYFYFRGSIKISIPHRQPYVLSCYVEAVIDILERMNTDEQKES